MEAISKVGNIVLRKGDVLKSPSGGKDWIVVDKHDNGDVRLASVSKYMNKTEKEVHEWFIKK
jgi:hypothetical protein